MNQECLVKEPALELPILDNGLTPMLKILHVRWDLKLHDILGELGRELLRLLLVVCPCQILHLQQIESHIFFEIRLYILAA